MRTVIHCRSCRRRLSAVLTAEALADPSSAEPDEALVPAGSLHRSDGTVFSGSADCLVINAKDKRRLVRRSGASTGCCGLDGLDGPNQLCACGAEVATEHSDCRAPHAVVFLRTAVELRDDAASTREYCVRDEAETVGTEPGRIARRGEWRYGGEVWAGVRIRVTTTRFGSGDYEDPPEIREDQAVAGFSVEWERADGDGWLSGSGTQFLTLEDALAAVMTATSGTVVWFAP